MQMDKGKIETEIADLSRSLSAVGGMLKGTVSKVVLGARKKGGGNRESYLLTYKEKGNKTRTVYVSKPRLVEVEGMIANYQEAKQTLERIVELNVRLFKMK